MNEPMTLVTGATGKTGALIVKQLIVSGWPVRALMRRNDSRSEALRKIGAEVVVADLYDSAEMTEALDGVSRVYYCPPIQPYMIQAAVAFAVAARSARLESIVLLSQWLSSPRHPSIMTRQTWLVDQLFAMIPEVSFTILNPGWFADNNLRVINFAAHLGVFPILTGHSRNAPPSNEDIARVAAAVLMDPAQHAGRSYRITGPQLLSAYDMLEILSIVLKRKVRGVPMPLWMLYKAARMQGSSAFEQSSLRHYVEDHKQGAFELNAPTNHVLKVTGRPAEDFETTVRRYASSPEAKRSFSNWAREFARFMWTPLAPGYDIARFDRQMGFPRQANTFYAMEDDQWIATHQPDPLQKIAPGVSHSGELAR